MKAEEYGTGNEASAPVVQVPVIDRPLVIRRHWRIEKYVGDFKDSKDIPKDLKPYDVVDFEGNVLLNEGINALWTLVAGTGATKFDNTNAYIGIGDSSAAEGPTQTGLQAAVNKTYKAMDGGYPTYGTSQKATWRSTFASGDANYAWNEITVANGSSDAAVNLNRKIQTMGTKASGTSWVVTLEITIS